MMCDENEWTRADDLLVLERIISAIYFSRELCGMFQTHLTMFPIKFSRVKICGCKQISLCIRNTFPSVWIAEWLNTDEENSLNAASLTLARIRRDYPSLQLIHRWFAFLSFVLLVCDSSTFNLSFETILPNIMQITMNFAEGKSTRLTHTRVHAHTHTHIHTKNNYIIKNTISNLIRLVLVHNKRNLTKDRNQTFVESLLPRGNDLCTTKWLYRRMT